MLLFPTSRSFEYTSTKWRTLGVLLFSRTSRSIEYMSTKWLWVSSAAAAGEIHPRVGGEDGGCDARGVGDVLGGIHPRVGGEDTPLTGSL